MGISKKLRFDLFKRDGFACQYCGRKPPTVILEVDHIIPKSLGGTDDLINLATSCFDCNRGKGAATLREMPSSVSEELKKRRELAEQTAAFNQYLLDLRNVELETIQRLGSYWYNKCRGRGEKRDRFTFGEGRVASVRRFLQDLPEADVLDAIDAAHAKHPLIGYRQSDERTWRYFCGICWTKIRESK